MHLPLRSVSCVATATFSVWALRSRPMRTTLEHGLDRLTFEKPVAADPPPLGMVAGEAN